ncbi:hypothetical protein KSS87_011189 [Heliosperma pusillum]|nr:hypothetical protein KSS87_011189 [Heliosperma pusillum]
MRLVVELSNLQVYSEAPRRPQTNEKEMRVNELMTSCETHVQDWMITWNERNVLKSLSDHFIMLMNHLYLIDLHLSIELDIAQECCVCDSGRADVAETSRMKKMKRKRKKEHQRVFGFMVLTCNKR